MIDWWSVFTNALWIGGVAAALAIVSYSDWLSSAGGASLGSTSRSIIHNSGFLCCIAVASAGAGLGSAVWWQRGLWFLLAAALSALTVRSWSDHREDLYCE
jgi:hypothetical protein